MPHHRTVGVHDPHEQSEAAGVQRTQAAQDKLRRQARALRVWALVVLVPVAVIGAVLSFQSLYRAAVPVFGALLALGFPLLVDFLILGASLQYVAGSKTGRPRAGWRWTAHAGVAGTLTLNAMAARSLPEVPWHVTAPAVWSVLVELTAREVLGQWRAEHEPVADRIPLRLWLTAPVESARTWLRLARRVEGEQARARLDVGVHAAAVEALKLALPQRRARRVRRILRRQLRAGSLPPVAILGPLGWMDAADALPEVTPQSVLQAALRDTLRGAPVTGTPVAGPLVKAVRAALEPAPVLSDPPPPGSHGTESGDGPEPGDGTAPYAGTRRTPGQRLIDLTDADFPVPAPGRQEPGAGRQEPRAEPRPEPEPELWPEPAGAPRPEPRPRPAVVDRRPELQPLADEDEPVLIARASTGDRFADAMDIVRVHETISAAQLATQLRGLGWNLSDRTAGRILTEVREQLLRLDPWALPTP